MTSKRFFTTRASAPDIRHSAQAAEHATTSRAPLTFTDLDPREYGRLRRLAMRHFGPPERPEYLEAPRLGAALVRLTQNGGIDSSV